MPVDKYRRLEPPGRLVDVHYRGAWLRGLLKAYWREDGLWQAYVEFSHPNGVTQPKVFDQDDVRIGPLEWTSHLPVRGD